MDEVPRRIEHTVLGPETRWADVRAVLDAAGDLGMRACIPPWSVARASEYVDECEGDVPLVTVIDFPHGQGATEAACAAARQASADGAAELDLVANIGALKAGDDEGVREKIAGVVGAVDCAVKVIVEAPLLDDDEMHRIGEIVKDADGDYLKTATGFSGGGATVEDVALFAAYLPTKASGGIGSWTEAEAMFDAGAARIGASSGDVIVREWLAETGNG